MKEQYIQVGFTAMRGPDGSYLPAVPIYIKAEEGAEESEEKLIKEHGLIQRNIAEKSGFTEQQFSDMLCGRKIIRADYLIPIARAMRVSIQDIYDAGADYQPREAV